MQLSYPDLGSPPRGWTATRMGPAIRLVPPGATADGARAAIVVSPLVPVGPRMPDVETVLRQALAAEVAQAGLRIEVDEAVCDATSDGGLRGTRLDVTVRHPDAKLPQKRRYTMYRDDTWLYGIHYMADEPTFDFFVDTYDSAARSLGAPTGQAESVDQS